MRSELTETIFEKCPIIYRGVNLGPHQNLMCFGFECGSGWYDLILNLSLKVEQLTEELKDRGIEPEYLPVVVQVKEKYGGLRFYLNVGTDEMDQLIEKAEEESLRICDLCGAAGELRVIDGIYMTRCYEHLKIRAS